MVNYCCVSGCARNSKNNANLNFFSLPKDPNRQKVWLEAANREDLLEKVPEKSSVYRICSRHFATSTIVNRGPAPNAVPTLFLSSTDNCDDEDRKVRHSDIYCDNCKNAIYGFRYKCVTCTDYDLCMKCESRELHDHHYMLRISKQVKYKDVDDLVNKWRKFFKSEHVTTSKSEGISNLKSDSDSDGESATKNSTNNDILSSNMKLKILKEVVKVVRKTNALKDPPDVPTANKGIIGKKNDNPIKTKKRKSVECKNKKYISMGNKQFDQVGHVKHEDEQTAHLKSETAKEEIEKFTEELQECESKVLNYLNSSSDDEPINKYAKINPLSSNIYNKVKTCFKIGQNDKKVKEKSVDDIPFLEIDTTDEQLVKSEGFYKS